jgi:pyridoxamine 5'-phosphate oxidase
MSHYNPVLTALPNILGFIATSMISGYTLSYFARRLNPGRSRAYTNKAVSTTDVVEEATSTEEPSIADFRKEYSQRGLDEKTDPLILSGNPFFLFNEWLTHAIHSKTTEPNAMCLSTCVNNVPSSRYVLLKGFDENKGFMWFTNYQSRKSQELITNPHAAINFWWGELERQVRIEGIVEKCSSEESDHYFRQRPRGSQIGAWSSNQSRVIESREALEQQEINMLKKFENDSFIPRPIHWGGFYLNPLKMEFWKGRQSRLHDRIVFTRDNIHSSEWKIERLQP